MGLLDIQEIGVEVEHLGFTFTHVLRLPTPSELQEYERSLFKAIQKEDGSEDTKANALTASLDLYRKIVVRVEGVLDDGKIITNDTPTLLDQLIAKTPSSCRVAINYLVNINRVGQAKLKNV